MLRFSFDEVVLFQFGGIILCVYHYVCMSTLWGQLCNSLAFVHLKVIVVVFHISCLSCWRQVVIVSLSKAHLFSFSELNLVSTSSLFSDTSNPQARVRTKTSVTSDQYNIH